jgi:hypothetical protein
MQTLGELVSAHGVEVLEHLDRSVNVPVSAGLQFQGDLAVIPAVSRPVPSWGAPRKAEQAGARGNVIPQAGIAVIEAVGSGHEHRLLASVPGTVTFLPRDGQDLGLLEATEPAFLAHPEHGYLGIAPGSYVLRRQREQADEERMVAD